MQFLRVVVISSVLSMLAPTAAMAVDENGGFQAAQPYVSTCTPACNPMHGTCNADCSISCDKGWGDCNGTTGDGCETDLNADQPSGGIANCGKCGDNCACYVNATCTAGVCHGIVRANGSACDSPSVAGCHSEGACSAGECICTDGMDMAAPPPPVFHGSDMAHGHDLPGDCSFSGGGAATAWVLLAISIAMLLRRRRPS